MKYRTKQLVGQDLENLIDLVNKRVRTQAKMRALRAEVETTADELSALSEVSLAKLFGVCSNTIRYRTKTARERLKLLAPSDAVARVTVEVDDLEALPK